MHSTSSGRLAELNAAIERRQAIVDGPIAEDVAFLNMQALGWLGASTPHAGYTTGQVYNLEKYLKAEGFGEIFFGSLDDEGKTQHLRHLANLILYYKYVSEAQAGKKAFNDPKAQEKFIQYLKEAAVALESYDEVLREKALTREHQVLNILADFQSVIEAEETIHNLKNRYFFPGCAAGRGDAYQDSADGVEITFRNPVTGEDEVYKIRNIQTLLEDGSQDMSTLAKIYVPKVASADPHVIVAWRGSQTLEGWVSDTQMAPGVEGFLYHEKTILEQINRAIEEVSEQHEGAPVNVMFAGHSLGGSLAQHNFNSVQRALCRGSQDALGQALNASFKAACITEFEERISLKAMQHLLNDTDAVVIDPAKVKSLHVSGWNAPGTINSMSDSSRHCHDYLTQQHQIDQEPHFAIVHGDAVQVCGKRNLYVNKAGAVDGYPMEILEIDTTHTDATGKSVMVIAGGTFGFLAGTIVPVVGNVGGAALGVALGGGVAAAGTGITHTTKLFNDDGTYNLEPAHITGVSYWNNQTTADKAQVKSKVTPQSRLINEVAKLASNADLLSHRNMIERKHNPDFQTSNRLHVAAQNVSNASSVVYNSTLTGVNTLVNGTLGIFSSNSSSTSAPAALPAPVVNSDNDGDLDPPTQLDDAARENATPSNGATGGAAGSARN